MIKISYVEYAQLLRLSVCWICDEAINDNGKHDNFAYYVFPRR